MKVKITNYLYRDEIYSLARAVGLSVIVASSDELIISPPMFGYTGSQADFSAAVNKVVSEAEESFGISSGSIGMDWN